MVSKTTDFLIIGGGIIGLCIALQIHRRFPDCSIILIEKEKDVALHASGRNSGVLHAGFYYTADTLKARFSREGNRLLTEYCLEHNLPINRCGKLVVAQNEEELSILDQLLSRAKQNGVALYEVTEKDARDLEPKAITFQKALYSPTTASVDPRQVTATLRAEVSQKGIEVLTNTAFLKQQRSRVITTNGDIYAAYVVNTAGLYADKIARQYGFGLNYRILPFKGLYLYSNKTAAHPKLHIYPVPNLNQPFLGVHFTVTINGGIKLGPTAIPALWREHYRGLENFSLSEMRELMALEAGLFLRNDFQFRHLAYTEMSKYFKRRLVSLGAKLVRETHPNQFATWAGAGIRAQLYDIPSRKLIMDFCYEGDDRSFHILNAVSPAFTCALPFTDYLAQRIEDLLA